MAMGGNWTDETKAAARATREQHRQRDFVGARFRVQDRARVMLTFAGNEIEIVKAIRPGYTWLASDASGATFPVHTDWLSQFCDRIESEGTNGKHSTGSN